VTAADIGSIANLGLSRVGVDSFWKLCRMVKGFGRHAWSSIPGLHAGRCGSISECSEVGDSVACADGAGADMV
jgi:hypothetical protein